jgi:ectoine hydroxylase-related dioxygenase (phytanoyl-CoA dioxygenase family)
VVVDAPAGSAILFDAMLYHKAGVNSSGMTRRGINHIFALPLIHQPISFPRALAGKYSEDPHLRRLLGYDTEPARSAQDWREWKLKSAGT